jgi:transcriptional antiterminator NusG
MAKNWYVVHVYSGFEKKIAQQITEQAAQKGLAEQFEAVLVPSENVVEVKRGRKINSEHKFFPGYVLVKMDLTDDAWHLVKNTPKVTGFLGSKTKPSPISEAEAERILKQSQEGVDRPRPAVLYEIGEQVRVADGPFTSFNGTVEEVDEEKGRVKVSVLSLAARRRWNSNIPRWRSFSPSRSGSCPRAHTCDGRIRSGHRAKFATVK